MRPALITFLCLIAAPVLAQDVLVLPSGQTVELQEILWDDDGETSRFRFVAPWVIDAPDAGATVLDDMMTLCREFALPVQKALHPDSAELVISFASEPIEFGVMNADIVQFFEGFTVDGQDCIWSQH